tara:strand:- start:174 stop:407 length:234 start_codon:yes stop_codon:yes gene_type:complete
MTNWKVERCNYQRLEEVLNGLEDRSFLIDAIHSPTDNSGFWTIVAYKKNETCRIDESLLDALLEETTVDDEFIGGNA